MKIDYLQNSELIPIAYKTNAKGERTFVVTEEIKITLSDGFVLVIPKGFETDLMSVQQWLWSIIRPFDKALIGDIIHDALWVQQQSEIKRFGGSYEARKYADNERLTWRNKLAPEKKFKNYLTHYVVRLFGSLYYSRQIEIPN